MSAPLVEVRGFSYAFRGREVLREVDLEVREGDYLSIIGPNGAGKTTLLKCLLRILPGGSGSIRLAGRPLAEHGQRELARMVSYVPQAGGAVAPYTVGEFAMMGRYPHLSPFISVGRGDEEAVRRALELTGTADLAERRMTTLSGGERQKAFIAAALAQGARMMLLDEPTTFLDFKHQMEIHGILRQLNGEAGVTLVSVTHDVNGALSWARSVLALRDGRVVYSGGVEELAERGTLESIYDVQFLRSAHPASGRTMVIPRAPR